MKFHASIATAAVAILFSVSTAPTGTEDDTPVAAESSHQD